MADNNSRNLTANFTADTSGFSPKINELVQRLKTASQEFENNKTKIAALKAEMKNYQTELKRLENTSGPPTAEQAQQMQQLRERIAACATQLGTFNAAQRQLQADMNATNRELSEARDQFNGTGQAAATFGEVLKANIASEAILGTLRKTVDYLRQAAAYCYTVGSSFEASMSKVAAISLASTEELERLTAKAKELGATTKFTATEAAEAMSYMAMAGWKTEQMLQGIDGVIGLTAAAGGDLAATSDIVTDAITAFGLKAEDCAHFADILAAASSNANTSVALMGETFKYCAADAGSLGFSAEDTVTAIGLMASAGIKGTQAGTALRKLFTEMSGDLTLTSKEFGDITVKTANASGEMRPFIEIIKDLREEFSKLNDQEKTAAAKELVGQNAQTGFKTLMNASEEDFLKLTSAIQNCDGAAADMARTMSNNVQGAVTTMNSALEAVGNEVYDRFKGSLLDAVNVFTDMLGELNDDVKNGELGESVEDLGESFKNLAIEGAQVAKDILPSLVKVLTGAMNIISTFGTEIGSAVKAFIAFKGAMAIGSAITGLVNAFRTLAANIKTTDSVMKGLNATFNVSPIGLIATAISVATFAISEFAGHANKASESIGKLSQNTAEYKQKCDSLSDIAKQYEEISKSVDPDVDKTKSLKDIQDQLIQQFPDLAGKIDLVNGKYDEMSGRLQDVIDKTSETYRIQLNADLNKRKLAEIEEATKVFLHDDNITVTQEAVIKTDVELIKKQLADEYPDFAELINGTFDTHGDYITFKGNYDKRIEVMQKYYDILTEYQNGKYKGSNLETALSQEIANVEALRDGLVAAQNEFDNLNNKTVDSNETFTYDSSWYNKEQEEKYKREQAEKDAQEKALAAQHEKELKAAKELYDKEKQLADDMYSVGELAEAEYYAKLTELRDQYLEEKTHDWYVATAKIKSYQDQNLANQKAALAEAENVYKKTLAAIDAEIERHNRAKSDAEYEQKLADIEDRIKYGRLDEFEKYELEKERKRLEAEREEELFKRETADAKAAAQEVYNAQKALDNAAASTKEYTAELGSYTDALEAVSGVLSSVSDTLTAAANSSVVNNDNRTINQSVNATVSASNKTIDQLAQRILKMLTSKL